MSRVLVIARACAVEPDGPNIEAKLEHDCAPAQDELAAIRDDVAGLFEISFGAAAARVAVVTLPWVDELDGESAYREAFEPDVSPRELARKSAA